MSTPITPPQPAAGSLYWYHGPTAWDARADALWHSHCPDPYATGHDGEVWLDHVGGAFCSGCRHYEPGPATVPQPAALDTPTAVLTASIPAQYTPFPGGTEENPYSPDNPSPMGPPPDRTPMQVAPAPDRRPRMGFLRTIEQHLLGTTSTGGHSADDYPAAS